MKKEKNVTPLRWASKLLRYFCPIDLAEEMEGDFYEEFNYQAQHKGLRFAQWDYIRNVIGFILRFKRVSIRQYSFFNINLFQHYFAVAFRNLARHKAFSFINIVGLALGMFTCLIIVMLLADHMAFDKYNTQRDHIYRVVSLNKSQSRHYASSPSALRNELKEKYTGIEKVVCFYRGFGNEIGNRFLEKSTIPVAGLYADPEVFDVFEYELEYGDSKTALIEPYSVVLTKNTARKLFKEENPVGETINVGEIGIYKVTGVLKETSHKSHIGFEALASSSTVRSLAANNKSLDPSGITGPGIDDWRGVYASWVYLLLEKGKSTDDVQIDLDQIAKEHYGNEKSDEAIWRFQLQKLTEITPTRNSYGNEIGPVLHWTLVYFMVGLAVAILATSCFNFTNLSIARSLNRAKEIGVRKVTGAARWQIFVQFLSESVVISLLSLFLAVILIFLTKNFFLDLTLIRMTQWDLSANVYVFGIFTAFAVLVGIVAGLFPAAVLSGFAPVKVLRGLNNLKLISKTSLRKVLIVSQFSIALIFIITTIVVYNQMNLFFHTDHRFNIKNNIMVKLNRTSSDPLKTELTRYTAITSVTAASHLPATFFGSYWGKFKKTEEEKDWAEMLYYSVDEDYARNINVPLVAGRFFAQEAGNSNRNFIVINEEAVKAFHYASPLAALGESIITGRDSSRLEIIGVIGDYNHTMLTQRIAPMILIYLPEQFDILQVGYIGEYKEAARAIEKAWIKINPTIKVEYTRVEDEVFKFYNLIMGDLVKMLFVIACLAITICCLGMLGIVSYATETRIREISIRKIFGSTNAALVFLLSKGFFKLVLISTFIAVPIAYLINDFWLENIAYHTTLGGSVISLGVFILAMLAGITIFSQTLRATHIRPVDNLKME